MSASNPAARRPFLSSKPASCAGPSAIQRTISTREKPRRLASVHIKERASDTLGIPPHADRKSARSICFIAGGQGQLAGRTKAIYPALKACQTGSRLSPLPISGAHLFYVLRL